MKNLKNEKGAITIVVLVTMLFLLSFLMSAYMIVSNRAQKQKEISKGIQEEYSNKQDLNEIYNSYFNNEIIPIYTEEQLLKIGSDELLLINDKYCKMTWDATYALMNNLEFDVSSTEISSLIGSKDWTPINSNESFKGYFEGNGHTIKVTNSSDEVEIYSTLNNYKYYLKVGDFVNYPIEYTNYVTTDGSKEFTSQYSGWRVMSIEGKTIKLVSGGNPIQYGNRSVVGLKNSADWVSDGFGPIYEDDNFLDYIDENLATEAHCMTLAEYKELASTHEDLVKDSGVYLVTVDSPIETSDGIIVGMDIVLNNGSFMDYGNSFKCQTIWIRGFSDDTGGFKFGVRVVVTLNTGITINEKETIDGKEVWKIELTE